MSRKYEIGDIVTYDALPKTEFEIVDYMYGVNEPRYKLKNLPSSTNLPASVNESTLSLIKKRNPSKRFSIGDKVTYNLRKEDIYSIKDIYVDEHFTVRLKLQGVHGGEILEYDPIETDQIQLFKSDANLQHGSIVTDYSSYKPLHYKADDENDLIAMWAKIMTPDEFRSVMFSHITKYLYRYAKKSGETDFEKAKEFMRRLELFEKNTGKYGKGD